MKLIMEAWNSYLNEQIQLVSPTMEPNVSSGDIAQAAAASADAIPMILKNLENWYNEQNDLVRILIDLIDPTGLTDWPDARDKFNQYLDWYLLEDEDPEKDPIKGAFLFVNAVFALIMAVPLVDLIGVIGVGLKVKGMGKLKDALPRMDAPQEVIAMLLRNGKKIIKALTFGAGAYGAGILTHLGIQSLTREQLAKIKEMEEMAKAISDKEAELKELNRERTRAAARAAKRTKEKRKEDLEEKNIAELDTSEEATLARIKQNRDRVKAEKEKEKKEKGLENAEAVKRWKRKQREKDHASWVSRIKQKEKEEKER